MIKTLHTFVFVLVMLLIVQACLSYQERGQLYSKIALLNAEIEDIKNQNDIRDEIFAVHTDIQKLHGELFKVMQEQSNQFEQIHIENKNFLGKPKIQTHEFYQN